MQFTVRLDIEPGEFFTNMIFVVLVYSKKYTYAVTNNLHTFLHDAFFASFLIYSGLQAKSYNNLENTYCTFAVSQTQRIPVVKTDSFIEILLTFHGPKVREKEGHRKEILIQLAYYAAKNPIK